MLMHQMNSVVVVEQKAEETLPHKVVFYCCYNLVEVQFNM